ncbi:MAG: LacI family transcriptional regulator [Clostridium sp.]|nr:LacI family transcriptional regulator [Acetatifactor muris]MCM1526730.1 LacI family transcriptional regulator [Bacteroides sp.]MCM1562810.1 LacI family transcriptional regulator [Clostridium sp.]
MPDNDRQMMRESGRMTISDVAEALQISKTTVSRAISGKGRIGSETRERVLAYIDKHNYHPNPMAKGLAQLKTYNIAWVMPGDSGVTDLPFFQRCMLGIGEVAANYDYDILLVMVYDRDMSQLRRIVQNHKVDGIVLGRTLVEDERVEFLKKADIPFVVIGSSPVPGVVQIDNDHVAACRELTSILLMKGVHRPALIGGDDNHVVNRTRKKGFLEGLERNGIDPRESRVYMDCRERDDVGHAVEDCLRDGADCIICMDDRICSDVLEKLKGAQIRVPEQIRLASFYDSILLENSAPAITALRYDPRNLGMVAAKTLFRLIKGESVEEITYLSYEMALKESTQ